MCGYSLELNNTPNNYTVSEVGDLLYEETIADIRNKKSLKEAIKRQILILYFILQSTFRRESYNFPIETVPTSSIGSLNVLEGLREIVL